MQCPRCSKPLLEIDDHKACEDCGWHTEGFEKLQEPASPDDYVAKMAALMLPTREVLAKMEAVMMLPRAKEALAKMAATSQVVGSALPHRPVQGAQPWDRVRALQAKWFADKSPAAPSVEKTAEPQQPQDVTPLERERTIPDANVESTVSAKRQK